MGKNNEQIDKSAPSRVRKEVKKGVRRSRRAQERQILDKVKKGEIEDAEDLDPRHTGGWTD